MLGKEDESRPASGTTQRPYFRSASWTDRSPTKPINPLPRLHPNSKFRACLPPLQPLSITRRTAEEWPKAGSDDLGIWPHPPTPRGSVPPHNTDKELPPVREFEFKKDKLAFFDKECSKIVDHIYLGSDAVAKNRDVLMQNKITHVLNCVGFVCPEYFKNDFVYKTLWLQDSPSEDITSILYDVFDYFEDVREQNGRVLVHCCQGVSRSTALVIAYLMWRQGQSFEDAFQYVKAARGVTNPNMGFACQLLQCQKRVHAVPASPSSILRMYKMAPHSPYDPLHLVPKMLNNPGVNGLDSRGAFVVHIPSVIYVWMGKKCDLMMKNMAGVAASQVVTYEQAKGPIVTIEEGEEPLEFWDALAGGEDALSLREDKVGERNVDDYNVDFEIFFKALSDKAVMPFSGTDNGLVRESGWGRVQRKLSNMKELSSNITTTNTTTTASPTQDEVFRIDPSSPTTYLCSLETHTLLTETNPPSSPDSLSYFQGSNVMFGTKSPTLSPSTSDYSSFTFSPSSSNWSDFSYFSSSQQASPSGMESMEPIPDLPSKSMGQISDSCPSKGLSPPSIAERRGSHPPPLMLLPSGEEPRKARRSMVRSFSFSLPELDDDDDLMVDSNNEDNDICLSDKAP